MAYPIKRFFFISVCSVLTACATQQETAHEKDDMLAAAGFTIIPANTAQRRLELESLPPNRVVQKTHGSRVVFLYADPYACGCLYVGDQNAWDAYRRQRFQQDLVQQQRLTAELDADGAWNWQTWGHGWWD